MSGISRIALALLIIGGINWGLIGLFQFDLVASLFGGQDEFLSRLVYGLVGLSALVCLGLLFKSDEEKAAATDRSQSYSNQNLRTEFGKEPDFNKEQDTKEKKTNNGTDDMK